LSYYLPPKESVTCELRYYIPHKEPVTCDLRYYLPQNVKSDKTLCRT
jgi:hypothetical protein